MKGWVESQNNNQAHPQSHDELERFVMAQEAYAFLGLLIEPKPRHFWQRPCWWKNAATWAAIGGVIAAFWTFAIATVINLIT